MASPQQKQRRTKKIEKHSFHVKKGDTVLVISGKDKGKTGTVKQIFTSKGKVLVEGLNIIKKAVRPNPMVGQQGGVIEMEAPLYSDKVMLYCLKCSKPTRIKVNTLETGKRVRICRHCQEQIDS